MLKGKYSFSVDASGNLTPSTALAVRNFGDNSLATIYDADGAAINQASFTSDSDGKIVFWAGPGTYTLEVGVGASQTKEVFTLGEGFDTVAGLLADTSLAYSPANDYEAPAVVGDIITAGPHRYSVVASGATDNHVATAGGVKLDVVPGVAWDLSAFGAVGDGATDDTAAITAWLKAAVAATADAPQTLVAQGHFLTDELPIVSQYEAGTLALQTDTLTFNLTGARFEHSGTGNGIFTFEGDGSDRWRVDVNGGQFIPHADSVWLIRTTDLRGSTISPESLGAVAQGSGLTYNVIGLLVTIKRTWSENMRLGSSRTLEFRGTGHGIVTLKRSWTWAYDAYLANPAYFPAGSNLISGEYVDDAAAVAAKGSAAAEGDYYLQVANGYKGYRVYNGASWVPGLRLRGAVFGWHDVGYVTSDPAGEKGDLAFNTDDDNVRVYDGSAWQTAETITDVDEDLTDTGAESFARMTIDNVLMAGAHDYTYDGIMLYCGGAGIYDSFIGYARGNVSNDGGSMVYLDGNYFINTVMGPWGFEKANVSASAVSALFRVGPEMASNPRLPVISGINWSGGYAKRADPDAGLVFNGALEDDVSLTAGTAVTVIPAGLIKPDSSFKVYVKSNGNQVFAEATVGRKSGTDALIISDAANSLATWPFTVTSPSAGTSLTQMDGDRFIAPRSGSLVGVSALTNANVAGDTVNFEARISAGDLNDTGSNPGLDCTIAVGEFGQNVSQNAGLDTFDALNNLYMVYETGATFSGPTAMQAQITVRLDGTEIWGEDADGNLTLTASSTQDVTVVTEVIKAS